MEKKVRDVEWAQVEYRLEQILQANILSSGCNCYIANMGGLSKVNLDALKDRNDLEFIRIDQFKPKSFFQKIILTFLTSHWGVARIKSLLKIKDILGDMTEQTMAEIYIFDQKHETEFTSKISTIESPLEISDFVEQFADFFMYQLDADNYESKTGMVEIISYGEECPENLKDISEYSFFK